MRGIRSIINRFRHIKGNNTLVGAFFALGLLSFGGLGVAQYTSAQAAVAQDCSNNSIMRCGAANATEFRNKYNQNASGDLPAIYGHYWIPRDIQVVQGYSYKDNTVRVNGRVVAKNAQSIGREAINGSHPISIAGRTYYETPNSAAFVSDGLPTMVALDAAGNFKYAIINPCGNPIYATPVPPPTPPKPPTPKYTCDMLNMTDVTINKKRFTASASATNGAQIVGYTFDFGDGSKQDTTGPTVEHEYAAAGTYTAKVTVKVKVGNEVKLVDGANCVKQFTIKAPADVDCTALTAVAKGNNAYDFTIQERHVNATYKGATMDYGDGTNQQISGTTASHQYAKAGNYTITATLSFDVDGTVKRATCQTQVTMEACPTNPNLPKDSPDCAPCEYDASLPKDSPKCEAPVMELPQTGAGNMILSGFGIGSMMVSVSLYLGSRRDLLAAFLGR